MKYNLINTDNYLLVFDDSEIKEGDWFFRDGSIHKCFRVHRTDIEFLTSIDSIYCGSNTFWSKEFCQKIILTTDPDLIADGVQAIDDEFLEWFVRNPSCEEVKVEEVYPLTCCIQKEGKTKMNSGCMERNRCMNYKIIISQEEPKQKTVKEDAEIDLTNLCYYDKRNPDYLPYDEDDLTKMPSDCYCDNCFYGRSKLTEQLIWQKDRMYSEEEVIAIVEKSRETGLTAEYLLLTEQFKKK